MRFVNVGYGNLVSCERIVSVAQPDSAPIKRMVLEAKESGRAIDLCCGKKCKSVLVCDTDHIIICSITPETLFQRMEKNDNEIEDED
ncbi:MAG: DUF370 domain-containing protein [Ruminococcaceae bacterium]|nr:DUF370 domain-containing protein [Oscillospiraceae bacterium]